MTKTILAIDACTRLAGIALAQEGRVLAEHTWMAGQDHTAQLAPRIQLLLAQSSLAPDDLSAIAVAIGPGSFNGVRAGMALAKGMAFALNIPLAGLSTLEVQAYPFASTGLPVCAIQDAGRGELAVAVFRTQRLLWRRLHPEAITSWDQLQDLIPRPTIICGDIHPDLAAEIRRRLGGKALLSSPAAGPRRAGYLAELGWMQIKEGKAGDPSLVQPLYLRRPAVTERRKP